MRKAPMRNQRRGNLAYKYVKALNLIEILQFVRKTCPSAGLSRRRLCIGAFRKPSLFKMGGIWGNGSKQSVPLAAEAKAAGYT